MAACTLHIGPRRVLVSADGPPAAEYALFDSSDVELTQGEGGGLAESGYRTTAAEALHRLAVAGITPDLAGECAAIVRGRVAEAYARGPVVRRVASLLDAAELFEGGTYDATLRRYEGVWLDLPLLANDAAVTRATSVLQALSLVAVLGEVAGDAPVVLFTAGHTAAVRLGERTARRQAVAGADAVARALRNLAEGHPLPQATAEGPGREVLEANLKARLEACVNEEAREHIFRVGRALHERTRPSHGPLSDGELWEIDRAIVRGELRGALQRLEARERQAGREPATIYLRARVALADGHEAPRAIAQKISELALSMSNFPEIELLAAQAWDAAGETRAAIPFARDLVSNPRVHEEVRAAAEAILRSPRAPLEGVGTRDFEASATGELVRASRPPPASQYPPHAPPSNRPRATSRPPAAGTHDSLPPPTQRPSPPPVTQRAPDVAPPTRRSSPPDESSPAARSVRPPALAAPAPPPAAARPGSVAPPPPSRDPRVDSDPPAAGERRTLTPPEVPRSQPPPRDLRRYLTPPERIASPLPPRSGARASVPPPGRVPANEPGRPASDRPARTSEAPPSMRPSGRLVSAAPWPTALRAPREENVRPEEIEHTPAPPRSISRQFMRGASMPPLVSEPPPAVARVPVVPRVDIDEPELIETLPLPRGASEAPHDAGVVPRTPLEARARFTLDARELARRYRHEDGVELRLELRTISVMQRRLADRFRARVVSTAEEAREAELHGALLSEMLARLMDAEWVDIAPTELGYWAMAIPARGREGASGSDKRVWPFGRVLRFIASGGEDDLSAFVRKLRELG